MAREGIKACQFLLMGIKELAYGQLDSQKLKAELNKTARDLGMKEGKIRSVIIQKDRSALLEVDSDAAAKWFTNAIKSVEFSSRLGDNVAFRTRIYNTLALNIPLNIDPRDEKHREEINEANDLEENTIAAI